MATFKNTYYRKFVAVNEDETQPDRIVQVQVKKRIVFTKKKIVCFHNDAMYDGRVASFTFKNKKQIKAIIDALKKLL